MALAKRYGEDLPVAELVKRALRTECESRWPRLSITVAVENARRAIPDGRSGHKAPSGNGTQRQKSQCRG
jgi:hypothetical protein